MSSSCVPDLTFHNGDPLTTEDVKFSFDRYQGAGATELKEKVARVEIVDPRIIRFHLKEIWPDFMTVYGSTASAAGLVVPKKYIEKVGDEGFKQASDRRRPLQIRQHAAGRRGRVRGLRQVLAQEAQREEYRVAQRTRCRFAGADGQDRRGGYRGRAGERRRAGSDR